MVKHRELEGVHVILFVKKRLISPPNETNASSFASSSASESGVVDFNM